MRIDEWTISTGSHVPMERWHGEARRLRDLLDVVANHVSEAYGVPLVWHSEDVTSDQWADLNAIAAEMVASRRLDDFGNMLDFVGTSSVVQGRLSDRPKNMINSFWTAGALDEWPFTATFGFYTRYPTDQGGARVLREHSVSWLISLVGGVVEASDAATVRITNNRLLDELIDVRDAVQASTVTYVPPEVDAAGLPDTLTVYPCPAPAGGSVVVADLELAANAPERLVDDLLLLDDRLRARTP
ncbi:hypothetical protein [Rhizohabitans arisaemae]|uniref:hypothetical protein n=1 Tax=Rhizohabitans arisaemae TaxID=2720610 RepID=UPI0024B1041D|nr:hypothetical protein [Rhizohabitans arisaemae]